MKETIVVSNINDRELLKSFALQSKETFNVRFFNAANIAKESLLRCGKIITKKEVSNIEQECIIYNLLKEVPYFKDSSFSDAKNINNAITYARKLCRGNEENKLEEVFTGGDFKDKNQAILEVYKKYKEYLNKNNQTDSIEIINYAINNANKIDAEFVILKETPLEPLEEELLKVVSNNQYSEKRVYELINLEAIKLKNVTYANAYGSVNEVEYILGYIANNKIPYDECTIALLDSSYQEQFLDYKNTYHIPMTFGMGQDISLSNSFKVLTLLDRWNKQYNAIDTFNDLMNAPEFNTNKLWSNISSEELNDRTKSEIIKTIGNLKLSVYPDEKLNKYKESITDKGELKRFTYVEKLAKELFSGYSYLIKTYTNIENEELENKAISTICNYIDNYFTNIPDKENSNNLYQQLDDIIKGLSSKKILREISKPGYIHITDLSDALSCVRKHLFICGLNAKSFPGSPKENYLLLDSDLERFNEQNVKDSNKKVQLNKELLFDVVNNATAMNSKIHLSYSGYNLADLKQENPSSMLFELFKLERGNTTTTKELDETIGRQYHYFDENVSSLKNIGNEYLEGHLVNKELINKEENVSSSKLTYTISPSAADIFFDCPRRFYLTKIVGIEEPEEDDPFKTLPANDEGTLVHECMEDYGNTPNWTKQDFMNNAEKKLEDYLNKRIPLHTKDIESLKKEYLRMAEIGYNNDPKQKEVVASEKYLGPYIDPITGLSFGGIVDRIEKLPNGKYRIVDYKTYKVKQNEEGDIDSCFQVVLYAYILENGEDKKEVEDCEYRYLRNPMTIKVGYQDIKDRLKDKLMQIKDALDSGDFPYAQEKEIACKYCKLKDVCGVNKEDKING